VTPSWPLLARLHGDDIAILTFGFEASERIERRAELTEFARGFADPDEQAGTFNCGTYITGMYALFRTPVNM
jgi:hypothetical protein